MFIRIENEIVNMDQIVWARYTAPTPRFSGDPTKQLWPCALIIVCTNPNVRVELRGDQAIEVWEKLLQYGDFAGGE